MKAIYKYPLEIADTQTVLIPETHNALAVQVQQTIKPFLDIALAPKLCLWAIIDTDTPLKPCKIQMYGTGHLIPDDAGKYLGTVQLNNGALVIHVFMDN